jgi:phage-related tail fiber protein
MRGDFVRGWDNGRGVDSGRSLASWQAQSVQRHSHQRNAYGYPNGGWGSGPYGQALNGWNNGFFDIYDSAWNLQADETRPRNVALLACMKM